MNSIPQELLGGQVELDSLVKELIKDFLETLLKVSKVRTREIIKEV